MIDGVGHNGNSHGGDPASALFELDGDGWFDMLREAETPLELGRLGSYTLEKEISRGGQGIVYRGRAAGGAPVAVKRLLAGALATPSARHRLEREVQVVSTLDHPSIVTLRGLEYDGGQPILGMEWIDGVPVTEWAASVEGGRRPPSRIARMMQSIGAAVQHAHQRGIIHRDLKPSNVLVDRDGVPHVLDFGLAKSDEAERSSVTLSGQFIGTPAYASPEQVRGGADALDVRSDVYSLGVMLFEMLTGVMPYPVGGALVEIFDSIEKSEPPSAATLAPGVNRELAAIVRKALAKRQCDRYQSVADLCDDLGRWERGEPVEAPVATAFYRARKTLRRHRVAVAVAAGIGLFVLGFGITMAVLYQHAERETVRAVQVQTFLEELLTQTGSYEGGGDLTVLEVLDHASERIGPELRGQPAAEAGVRYTLAQAYAGFWLWGKAAPHARRALELSRTQHPGDAVETANCLTLLGRTMTVLGDPQCIALQREAVDMRRRLYGHEHPLVAEATGNLAYAQWKMSETEVEQQEAERNYRSMLAMFDRVLDEPSLNWARGTYSYAAFLSMRGDLEQSDALYQDALARYRALGGSGDVYMSRCMEDYAWLLQRMERYDEAMAVLEESLQLRPDRLGQTRTPYQLWHLGRVQHTRGNLEACARLFDRSLALSCRGMARKFPGTADRLAELGFRLMGRQADPVDALVYLQVFTTLSELEGVEPLDLAQGLMDVALLRLDLGDTPGAVLLLDACLDLRQRELPASNLLIADTASMLGVLKAELGQFGAAEALLVPAWRAVRAELGDEHPIAGVTGARIVRLYEQWGRPADAARYRGLLPAGDPAQPPSSLIDDR
ncbi:MAG: serine/threonine protein kinase [Phycisphaerales bacterium]|nr:serine/threonine-protein kinase [Phycisphaerae bacterium]NNF42368.1 serine/threonine protein kinase [Phycisphaerales bacterium]NNM25201.1 serine/threonine protein kinase [Phycisphaerales bacterium]